MTKLARSARWLQVTQFLGALNDNMFKLVVVYFLINILGKSTGSTVALASGLFVLPFILFSHRAGRLADSHPKSSVIKATKIAEVILMAGGVVAMRAGSATALWVLLFLMCAQSAFFGPAKYGIIPELVSPERITRTNGHLVMLTYMAIVLGAAVPSLALLGGGGPSRYHALALLALAVSVAGTVASLQIGHTPVVGEPQARRALRHVAADLRNDHYLLLAVVGSTVFTFMGALVQQNLLVYGAEALGMRVELSGLLFMLAAVGIGLGAWMAGRSSGRTIEFGLLPVGALGLMLSTLLLGVVPARAPWPHLLFVGLGFASGTWTVPLNSFIQERAPAARRGEILGLTSVAGFSGVALASGLFAWLQGPLGVGPQICFALIGFVAAALAIGAVLTVPDFLTRFLVGLLTRTLYRIDVHGLENVPAKGGALLVPNHVAWSDACIVSAALDRRVRFLMSRRVYEATKLRPFCDQMRVIRISREDGPKQVLRALGEARQALLDGELVCIFPEGALSRTGNMMPFFAGFERIARGTGCPIIPVHLGGLWGSIMSLAHGKLFSRFPRKLPYPVTVQFGEPMDSNATAADVRRAVSLLAGNAVELRKGPTSTLPHQLIRRARRRWHHRAMLDSEDQQLSFGSVLLRSLVLAGLIRRKISHDEPRIGIMLPASIGGALANTAMALAGRTSVNLNFTASSEAIQTAVRACNLRTVITSRRFASMVSLPETGVDCLYLEDLAAEATALGKLTAWLRATVIPARWQLRGVHPDDTATIIFSSGSTGIPKGVCLTHHNILANCEALTTVIHGTPRDGMVGTLPFFHSFGYTATLWMPLLAGHRAAYHPDPLDAPAIARMIEKHELTVMIATPTFLTGYLRRATPQQLSSLRLVMTGAEKLPRATADAFAERFGVIPREGYGATELSPVVSLCIPDVEDSELQVTGTKPGSVGQCLPGVTARVVDRETGAPLPEGHEGLLEICGPSVMAGYLNDEARTREVIREGWYRSGDLATMDADGFITLVGRISRYSKIAGEMVPHEKVEQVLLDAIPETEGRTVAVTGVPDDRKGEKLVVLYTAAAGNVDNLIAAVKASDLPNLWKPKPKAYMQVDAIPQLGSGKLDLASLRKMATIGAATAR